jgi:hypothetical protein
MNQEKYIGMDVHDATVSAAVMNAEGKASCSWNACWKPRQPRFWNSFKGCVELWH